MILFGQSAGSASVDRYSYSWVSDPIGSGFLMASGAAGFGEALPLNNDAGGYKVSEVSVAAPTTLLTAQRYLHVYKAMVLGSC